MKFNKSEVYTITKALLYGAEYERDFYECFAGCDSKKDRAARQKALKNVKAFTGLRDKIFKRIQKESK